ncbi:hypothetical protein C0583_00615 [Candidatus Parcubacteria bacterium]|nr:MAG: hypothetical protein C0583_00615 [Candidatus Parcubacteria bacterium]
MQNLRKKLLAFDKKQDIFLFVIFLILLAQFIVASLFFVKLNKKVERLETLASDASYAANQTVIKQEELETKIEQLQNSNMILQSQILRSSVRNNN